MLGIEEITLDRREKYLPANGSEPVVACIHRICYADGLSKVDCNTLLGVQGLPTFAVAALVTSYVLESWVRTEFHLQTS